MTIHPELPRPGGLGADGPWGTREQRARLRQQVAGRQVDPIRLRLAAARRALERVADALTRVAGSTPFRVAHVLWFAGWIRWNAVLARRPFDPFPFGLLTMAVSLEAIVLSVFVLMSQRCES